MGEGLVARETEWKESMVCAVASEQIVIDFASNNEPAVM